MERNTLIKRLRGVMAMMLAVLLLAGNPLIAQAAGRYFGDINNNPLHIGDTFNEGDCIYANGTGGIYKVYINGTFIQENDSNYYYEEHENGDPTNYTFRYFHFLAGQFTLVRIDKTEFDPESWTYYFETPDRRNSQADDTAPAATSTPQAVRKLHFQA